MMSADNLEPDCCASCGIAEVDDIKLKKCDGCDLVRYCSDACREDHRSQHEEECKERTAELREEILFRQPENSYLGDCPICCLPLPITGKSTFHVCCGKLLCNGCSYASQMHQLRENMQRTCPFCRHPMPKTDEEVEKNLMKRIEAKDPHALCKLGLRVLKNGDHEGAFKYWTKAAELGDAIAHFQLSVMFEKGEGVDKDETKEIYHLEEAAIAGHPDARFHLGAHDGNNGRFERAVKHFNIAASLGDDKSLQSLKKCYKEGLVSKEDFAAALRAHHAAIKATKSPNREMAAAWARRQEVEKAK